MHLVPQACGDAADGGQDRLLVGDLRQHGDELVAADPRDDVLVAEAFGQPLGGGAQENVAGIVAERVVDVLEVVEVEQDQRAAAAIRKALAQGLVEAARSRSGWQGR